MSAVIKRAIFIVSVFCVPILQSCADLSIESSDAIVNSWSSVFINTSSIKSSSTSISISSASANGYFTDIRDGNVYGYVTIGSQVWMTRNLNYDTLNGSGSWCYDNNPNNCNNYGRLYRWATVMGISTYYNYQNYSGEISHKGICPSGWHVPTYSETLTLRNYIGGYSTAGTYLKSATGWNSYTGISQFNSYGFSALAGGNYSNSLTFSGLGYYGRWWTATALDSIVAYDLTMEYNSTGAYSGMGGYSDGIHYYYKTNAFSLRCLKN